MASLNIPSYNFLIPREHRIRAIQALYEAVTSNGGGSSGGGVIDGSSVSESAMQSGKLYMKDGKLYVGISHVSGTDYKVLSIGEDGIHVKGNNPLQSPSSFDILICQLVDDSPQIQPISEEDFEELESQDENTMYIVYEEEDS